MLKKIPLVSFQQVLYKPCSLSNICLLKNHYLTETLCKTVEPDLLLKYRLKRPITALKSHALDHRSIIIQYDVDHQSIVTSRAKVSDTFLNEFLNKPEHREKTTVDRDL